MDELSSMRLRRLPTLTRLGLTCAILVLVAGYVAAGVFVAEHHGPRDGRPGLSLDDVEGVYHGVTVEPLLLALLERGHPAEVARAPAPESADLAHLTAWLRSGRVAEDWDNIDLGDGYGSPAEVVADACATCHQRGGDATRRAAPPLEFWDDVAKVALPREVLPTDTALLLASTHAHGPAMSAIAILAIVLASLTRWPRLLVGLAALAAGAGLLVDLAAWWLARDTAGLAPIIVIGGAAHAAGTCALLAMALLELWLPSRPESASRHAAGA